jgi:hypothetical protein
VHQQRGPLGADDLGAGSDRTGRRLVDGIHRAHRYSNCSGAVFRPFDSGVHRLAPRGAGRDDAPMETDILIAALMVLASVAAALGIIIKVARATREEPRRKVKRAETAPVLRPASGW